MRHAIAGNRLGRNSSLRKATIRDMAKATLIRQRICTTKAKAKEARKLIDRLITLGKRGTLQSKRRAFAVLGDHGVVSLLFNTIASRFKARNGGYTRIIPLSRRRGDNAHMVLLELTEKDKVIITKSRSASHTKAQEAQTTAGTEGTPAAPVEETKKPKAAKGKVQTEQPAAEETKKERAPKPEPAKIHPKKDFPAPDKPKTPKIMGGIKKMFAKKPPSSGS